jgi:hypothetical protein
LLKQPGLREMRAAELATFLVVGRFARRTAASEITEPFNIELAFDSVSDAGGGFDPDATGWLRPHLAQGTWPLWLGWVRSRKRKSWWRRRPFSSDCLENCGG